MIATDSDLVRRAYETASSYERLGNEVFQACAATFVRNRSYPRRQDANYVGDVTCSTAAALDALFERVEDEFKGYPHRRFTVSPFSPPPFVARLALGDWSINRYLHLLLEGQPPCRDVVGEIRRIDSDADWRAYTRLRVLEWEESSFRRADKSLVDEFVASVRAKGEQAHHWLAWADGEARAYMSSWAGRNGVGMVEDLFTQREYRHRGLATALIAQGVADAREHGAGPIVIGAFVNDSPKRMYATMGFRPLFVSQSYTRHL